MIKFTLLILTHNRLEAVQQCFVSLASTLARNDVSCVVLDNASTDDTYLYLCREAPFQFYARDALTKNLTLLRSETNLGVAGGRAELLKAAQGQYIVFLDSDTVIHDNNWLDVLSKVLDENENVGLVGPFGSFVLPDFSGYTAARPNAECDCVAGACQMFRKSLLDLGVHIDQRYARFWGEDSDMAMQIREKGWDVWCVPVGIEHSPSHSGYGQEPGLHDAHIALFREQWRGKGLTRAEGAY